MIQIDKRQRISTIRLWLVLLSCTVCMPGHVAWAADGIRFQDGLPPELSINTRTPFGEQAERLGAMAKWSAEHQPQPKGGILHGISRMFVKSGEASVLTVEALAHNLGDVQGQTITVSGLLTATGTGSATLIAAGGEVAVSLGGGVKPEGFGTGDIAGLPATVTGLAESVGAPPRPAIHATKIVPAAWLATMRLARIKEMEGEYKQAADEYEQSAAAAKHAGSLLNGFALVRAADLAVHELQDAARAEKLYNRAWNECGMLNTNGQSAYLTWVPADSRWTEQPLREVVGPILDELNQASFWYKVVDGFAVIAGNSPGLGVILMAIAVRLMIWPLTRKQLESARSMQNLQPQIKALQDKYVDDKQKFQAEFWKLCQANGVNPLGGCLPMLVQFPILIMLYRGIRAYIWHFNGAGFLWVHNLAGPDMIMLVAYTISMIGFQKMTQKMQPAAAMNPQQAQQQQMMTYLMPVMFFFFFQTFPAAFILYWLASNVIYFGEQYVHSHMQRRGGAEEESAVTKKKGNRGLVAAMVSMLSSHDHTEKEQKRENGADRKSYAELKAAETGKRTRKTGKSKTRK